MAVQDSLIFYSVTDGIQSALDKAQDLQEACECFCEFGDLKEKEAAAFLLTRVNLSIKQLLKLKKHSKENHERVHPVPNKKRR